ncbi:thioredoxin family protein [Ramlibacter sp.]|uniref:thioredoxin family protein n=1 Tax=Ramlibacter sp. TaxID=1917967 RepID=UPI0017E486F8|nr:thioredoxin family protein [Ramlibacter sp.]MBA2674512.1 thioredoxin family protein [Ramlibacter sp.]
MQSAAASDTSAPVWVVCLCAAWCVACREWQPVFEDLARRHPGLRFAWVDIEDEDDAMGDVDIETFPTLLVARGGDALFLGPVLPSVPGVERLVTSLQAQAQPSANVAPTAKVLLTRLQSGVLARAAL